MSKTNKVTVRHYLNTKLKPVFEDSKEKYPIYVRLTHERKNLRFKSILCNKYYTDNDLLDIDIINKINIEIEIVNFIIRNYVNKSDDYDLVDVLEFLAGEIKYFTDMIILDRKIKENIVNYISKKTKLSIELLDEIINVQYIDTIKTIKTLDIEVFEDIQVKNKISFYKLLIEYYENHNNSFSVYYWRHKDGKQDFIEYLNNKKMKFDFKFEIEDIENRLYAREKHNNINLN